MKRFYTLLFNLTLISSYSIAKPSKIDSKYESDQQSEHLNGIQGKKVKYTIKAGDTLLAIAREHYTTRAEIRSLNNMKVGETLNLGRVLTVPTHTFYPKDLLVKHSIIKGDTLYTIAKKYKTTTAEICRINSITKDTNLKLGRILKVATNTYSNATPPPKETPKSTPTKEVHAKAPLTIASVVNEEREKSLELAKAKEAKEKEKALQLALKKQEAEEEAILKQAAAIKKKREERALAAKKAEEARIAAAKKAALIKAKALAEKARLAKLKAEAEAKALAVKKKAEAEAKERARQAKLEAERLEKERLQKLLDAENAKLAKIKKEMEELAKKATLKAELLVKTKEKIEQTKTKSKNLEEPKKEEKKEEKKLQSKAPEVKPEVKKELVQKKETPKNTPSSTPSTIVTQSNQTVEYKVKAGDNLYKIAKAHHTTTNEVKDANKFRSNSDLVIGKVIKVPIDTYFHLKDYKIRGGDTLYKIARKHNTTTSRVLLANKMNRKSKLIKGDVIKVPVDTFSLESDVDTVRLASNTKKKIDKKKTLPKTKLPQYKIKSGDTLYTIAKKSNSTIKQLKTLNKIKSTKELQIGAYIALPKGKKVNKIKLAKKEHTVRVRKNQAKKVVVESKQGKTFESFMSSLSDSSGRKALPKTAKKHLGKRYVWGATGPYRFDCSGFTSYVCKKNGVCLPRTSISQSKVGKYVSRNNLVAGDLIFFDTSKRRKGYVNHVGIYIGNNKFIHASSAKKKVVVTSLDKPFYKSRFKWGRRVDM